ncbi:AraC family transcriptional regulator [Peribacillus alkalitolerans]|uniref:AraC family transcriptional regulator n=1 Tax=Peribacillus alkalitolerans TaxID=1550385 RepID=UPI0013D6DD7F|nr:helix-turn-helix domain-containing protein [Peribacillus alkalitolerans]
MKYIEKQPPLELEPYIKCFWYLNRTYNDVDSGEILWPDGCHEMIIHYGSQYKSQGQTLPTACLIGTLSKYHFLEGNGEIRLFGIRFKPWGLIPVLEEKINLLKDQFLPLSILLKGIENIEKELEKAELEEGIGILKGFILERFDINKIEKELEFIELLSKLYSNPINQDVQTVIKESHYSPRQFERKCSDLIGLSAKKLSKVARFNQVRLKLFFNPSLDLHDCMNEFGYFDYSHFSKDFKERLGLTPNEYKKWMLDRSKKIDTSNKNVVFLQDESLKP